jgi:ATP-dependent DNA ligase
LFRRRQCIFIAFDLLYLNGKDLRIPPLLERKAMLKKLLRRKRSRILISIISKLTVLVVRADRQDRS